MRLLHVEACRSQLCIRPHDLPEQSFALVLGKIQNQKSFWHGCDLNFGFSCGFGMILDVMATLLIFELRISDARLEIATDASC